jgi:ribosomal protein S16
MIMSTVHPLRGAYAMVIYDVYGIPLRGDQNPIVTEQQAMKINRLGIDYKTYMGVAVKLCASLAKHNGWKYPYYNVVVGDKTIAKVQKLLDCTSVLDASNDNGDEESFEHELSYALAYIDWWMGKGAKPSRNGYKTDVAIVGKVAEYVCMLRGVRYTSSNYNVICRALEQLDG